MIAIEDKIDTFIVETTTSANEIIDGSNEHLDLILSVKKPLDNLADKFEALNLSLYQNLNSHSKEHLKNHLLPKLKEVNRVTIMLMGAVRTCYLYRDIRVSFKRIATQYDVLREIMHDIQNIKLANDEELDEILKDLNAM